MRGGSGGCLRDWVGGGRSGSVGGCFVGRRSENTRPRLTQRRKHCISGLDSGMDVCGALLNFFPLLGISKMKEPLNLTAFSVVTSSKRGYGCRSFALVRLVGGGGKRGSEGGGRFHLHGGSQ